MVKNGVTWVKNIKEKKKKKVINQIRTEHIKEKEEGKKKSSIRWPNGLGPQGVSYLHCN